VSSLSVCQHNAIKCSKVAFKGDRSCSLISYLIARYVPHSASFSHWWTNIRMAGCTEATKVSILNYKLQYCTFRQLWNAAFILLRVKWIRLIYFLQLKCLKTKQLYTIHWLQVITQSNICMFIKSNRSYKDESLNKCLIWNNLMWKRKISFGKQQQIIVISMT